MGRPMAHSCICQIDRNQFSHLWQVNQPPLTLYAQGTKEALTLLHSLPERGLAVVGTRYPLARSVSQTRERILELEGSGLIIISGFARGIDSTAHQAALDAKLATLAVVGNGLDILYPPENAELREKILAADGLIVSEFPTGTPPMGRNFINRNRLIAGWSKATWVVEAPERSGTLNTAKWARAQDRTCYVTPCYPGDPVLAGNQKLLEQCNATALWGTFNFGMTWLELSNPISSRSRRPRKGSDLDLLTHQVELLTWQSGGGEPAQLLSWALSLGWSPQRFFHTLQTTLKNRLLLDENGLLLKNSRESD